MLIKHELKFINKLKKLEKYNIDILNDIEQKLIRGEKFEKMWEKFYNVWGEYPIELHSIEEFMDDIEQEYFPEEDK